jgi:hypothetical protein
MGKAHGFSSIIVVITILGILIVVGYFLISKSSNHDILQQETKHSQESSTTTSQSLNTQGISNNLSLPFNIEDLSKNSAILNPLGIIRHNKDKGHGHSGIDFPLKQGSQIVAVSNGKIIEINKDSETEGDEKLVILLKDSGNGEGWVYVYEHILIANDLKIGDKINKGDIVGSHIQSNRTSHYQLSRSFNNYMFYEEGKCWPDLLNPEEQASLNNFWQQYRVSDHALGVWKSSNEDGNYSFRALLDKEKFPNGVQLCYIPTVDARIPLN